MCSGADQITSNPANTLGAFGAVMNTIGGMVSAGTAQRVGSNQRTAAYFTAQQQDDAANNVLAAGQRMAMSEDLKAQLLASRAMAVAGANGGDVTSPGVTKIISDIAGRGAYNAGVALYDAEDKARTLRLSASGSRYEGDVAEAGGRSKAASYLFGAAANSAAASSLFSKYGRGGPSKREASPLDDFQTGGTT